MQSHSFCTTALAREDTNVGSHSAIVGPKHNLDSGANEFEVTLRKPSSQSFRMWCTLFHGG